MGTLLYNLLELIAILAKVADDLGERLGRLLSDLLGNIFNPLAMADAVIGFFTGTAGVVIAAFGTFYWDDAAQLYKPGQQASFEEDIGKPYQHVMTPEAALRFAGDCMAEGLKAVTQTGDNSLKDVILQRIGMWLYRVIKGGPLRTLLKILKWQSEADAINFFRTKIGDAKGSLLVSAVIAAFIALLTLCCATASKVAFIGATISAPRLWEQHVLFYKHPRQKERVRISRRVGGVRP